MGAQDNTEKVLRSLHVLLSKSEPYPKEPSKVIIDKQQVIDLLAELNTCIYQIMDEYELTIRSRDKAERDFHKRRIRSSGMQAVRQRTFMRHLSCIWMKR